ncbi:MAG: MerR family transcriptional regulator [Fusobacterium sp. JB021]|nr:MerR family transcriptional regulator [Fusobacterium sp. JB021]
MNREEFLNILDSYNIDVKDIGEDVVEQLLNDKYKIGDIAKFLGVSVDTLRLYDKKEIVVPYRDNNGYRYYTRNQMIILNYVMHLRKANLSLDNIKTIVNSTELENSIGLMELSEIEIDKQLKTLKEIFP